VLGTVCVIGTSPLPKDTGQTSPALIKRHRDALMELPMDLLGQRAGAGSGRHSST
jgi:hypothetical protein